MLTFNRGPCELTRTARREASCACVLLVLKFDCYYQLLGSGSTYLESAQVYFLGTRLGFGI